MKEFPADLLALKQQINQLSKQRTDDLIALQQLLNCLEESYVLIREGPFMAALPNTRKGLFKALQEMEEASTWPVLPRFQMQDLLDRIQDEPPTSAT